MPTEFGRSIGAVAAVAVWVGCGAPGGPGEAGSAAGIAVVDDAGRSTVLAAPARRVVSLVPSVTETIVALGSVDRLAARTRYDEAPALAHLPSVGGGLDPSVERIVALDPDLVVAWNARDDRTLAPRLEAAGIPVYRAEVQDTAGVFRTIARFGALLGREEAAAGLARSLRDTLAAVAAGSAGRTRPTAFYLIAGEPPRTAGAATFLGELLSIAGARSAFPELREGWPAVSLEAVVARSPDIVVLPSGPGLPDAAALAERPGWRDLAALREGRVVEVPADLVARPGPGIGRAARALARAVDAVAGRGPR